MRLPREYAEFFKKEVGALRPDAAVYLFGSRANPAPKGGDVDILVICEPKLTFLEMSQLRRRFWERFG